MRNSSFFIYSKIMIFAYLDVLLLSFTSYNLQTVNEFWIVYMLTSMRVVTHAVC